MLSWRYPPPADMWQVRPKHPLSKWPQQVLVSTVVKSYSHSVQASRPEMQTHGHLQSSLLRWHEFHSSMPEGYLPDCSTLDGGLSCPAGKIYGQIFAVDISLLQKKTLKQNVFKNYMFHPVVQNSPMWKICQNRTVIIETKVT